MLDEVVGFALPLRRRFRGTDVREGLLLRVGDLWGEWAPFPEYDDDVAARWLLGALEAAHGEWPRRRRDDVAVNAIVPALDPGPAAELVVDAVTVDGCTVIKVKVAERGQAFDDDVARVAAVRASLDDAGASAGRIRVDVNGAWTVDEAAERLDVLADIADGLEYAEQPCATLTECAELRGRLPHVPVAVDEGARLAVTHDDALVAAIRDAADVVVLKAIPLGGVRPAVELAARLGLPVTVSGSLDSTVGLSSALALAGALDDEPLASGLGTGRLLAADTVDATALPRDGRLSVVRHVPDPAALASVRLDDERARWWHDRLQRCLEIVERTTT
jgi:O-succinylbenzoate synthase